ncbi:hypothetical protein V6N13_134466 [Hibiscus sabdariffa]|uniref:Serine hydroxymethyltransferase n=1 Tax=Hibiscus sabdariffa TaxID=183260 RepID=A0ABR2R482_9ROSI
MDLSSQSTDTSSTLSLGLVSQSPSSHRSQIADDSVTLQLGTRESTHPFRPVPLQLLEPHQNGNPIERERSYDDDDEESRETEEFHILGHPMCLKRRRDSCSSSSPSLPLKRVTPEPGLDLRKAAVKSWGSQPLRVADPDVFDMMEQEKKRQFMGIELIASENFVCRAVMDALGSHLTNKYSEGMPGARYYGGNQYIDEIETLCWKRALEAFRLDSENWGVNVQPYSCTSANFAVYTALLLPGDRIMGLDTPSGGNTSHGYYLPNGRKVSGASIFFESFPYKVNPQTGYIDYEKLEERALDFRPKILICGGSSYPREWDYARFRQIADKCGAVLLCDMAQISGLIAAKEAANPFEYCDIVTSTTHKSLRGPRGGIIFYRRGKKPRKGGMLPSQGDCNEQYDFEEKINFAVFPSLQGGPHNNHIAALAIALKQVATPEYEAYMQQVKKNAQALASSLLRRKCKLITGGTDNHLLLWDLRPFGLTGKVYEKVCEMCHITLNKIAIFGENGVITPGGVRIGTPAMTTRGCVESDFDTIATFLLRAAHIASTMQNDHKLQKTSLKSLLENKDILELRSQVEAFASQFAMPEYVAVKLATPSTVVQDHVLRVSEKQVLNDVDA